MNPLPYWGPSPPLIKSTGPFETRIITFAGSLLGRVSLARCPLFYYWWPRPTRWLPVLVPPLRSQAKREAELAPYGKRTCSVKGTNSGLAVLKEVKGVKKETAFGFSPGVPMPFLCSPRFNISCPFGVVRPCPPFYAL